MRSRELTPLNKNSIGFGRMSHLFDDFWSDFPRPLFGGLREWSGMEMPRVDVTEDDTSFHISAELPGMDDKDVEVSLEDDRLVIKGEKKAEKTEETEEGHTYTERSYGKFERSFPVGKNVKADKVEAKFDKGVLTVTLPKTEETPDSVHKIKIKS